MVNSNISSNLNNSGNASIRSGNSNNLTKNVTNLTKNNNSKGVKNTLSNTFSSVSSLFGANKNNKTNKTNSGKNNSNNQVKTNSNSNKSSMIFIVVAVILLVVVLGIAGYFVHRYMKQKNPSELETKQFIPYIHDASIDKRISSGSIPSSADGNEYNMNFWIYVNDYTVNKDVDKCVLYRGETPEGTLNNASVEASGGNPNLSCNPGVWLLRNVNTLRIVVGLETNYNQSECGPTPQVCQSGAQDVDICEIENFPLQRWVNVNITMRNNVIDVFFDGALKKSCILKGFPVLSNNDMLICPDGGFNGYISNMKYSNKALAISKIESMYKSGPTL
jgi:hypothetical protein